MSVETTTLTYKGETFLLSQYNGFKILIRQKDGFVNATKLCQEICLKENKRTKEFHNIKRSPQFTDYVEYIMIKNESSQIERTTLYYDIGQKIGNNYKGFYIHESLINCVLVLTSVKYMDTVSKIMDKINELGHVKGLSFEENTAELIDNMQQKIDMFKQKYEQSEKEKTEITQKYYQSETNNYHLQEAVEELSSENSDLEDALLNRAVPEENCVKKLSIIRVKNGFKVSANSSHPNKDFEYQFIFPASMNVKQLIKNEFGSYTFVEIDKLVEFLKSKDPKDIISKA